MEKLIRKIISASEGSEVYAVGGFVRDLFMKRGCRDIDLVVNKDAAKFSKRAAKLLGGKLIELDDVNKIYRIVLKNEKVANVDISLYDGKNINEDLNKRDFTINAAAFKIADFPRFADNLIFANKECAADLRSKTVNTVNAGSFKRDPLRMLRAFRFYSEPGFKIKASLLKQVKKDAGLIKKIAPERIKNELFMILSQRNSCGAFDTMDKWGLLPALFPEITKMKKASKKYYYHPGGLFQHSFETMCAVENILNDLNKYFPENSAELEKHFYGQGEYSEHVTRGALLKFTALFHDSAKPETAKKEGAKMRFFGHEDLGAQKVESIMKRLKTGNKDIKAAKFLVENHMRPSTLTKNNTVTKKAAMKLFRDIGDNTPDLIVLSMADWHSYKHLKVFAPKELKMQEKSVRKLISMYYEIKNAKPLVKLIDGNIIMKKFKLKPGPWVGDLITIVNEAQQEGKISDSSGALRLVSSKLTAVKKKYKI